MAGADKITVRVAAEIRAAAAAGESYRSLGRRYGIHHTTASRVARGIYASTLPGEFAEKRPRFKLRCINGHLLAETRAPNGRCRTCSRDRLRARRAAGMTRL